MNVSVNVTRVYTRAVLHRYRDGVPGFRKIGNDVRFMTAIKNNSAAAQSVRDKKHLKCPDATGCVVGEAIVT